MGQGEGEKWQGYGRYINKKLIRLLRKTGESVVKDFHTKKRKFSGKFV